MKDARAHLADRARSAAEVVSWLRRSHRRLPPRLLALELAQPRAILSAWVVGQRTRGALERLLCTPGGPATRTLGEYLAAPWVGMHGVVDLLAAHEEQGLGEAVAPASAAVEGHDDARRMATLIRGLLPTLPADLLKAVRAGGFASEVGTMDDIVRFLRERRVAAPFRVVRRRGAIVLVASLYVVPSTSRIDEPERDGTSPIAASAI